MNRLLKKCCVGLLAGTFMITPLQAAPIIVNGTHHDVPTLTHNSRTMVGLRDLATLLNIRVDYNAEFKYVLLDNDIAIALPDAKYLIGLKYLQVETEPVLENGSTYIALRDITNYYAYDITQTADKVVKISFNEETSGEQAELRMQDYMYGSLVYAARVLEINANDIIELTDEERVYTLEEMESYKRRVPPITTGYEDFIAARAEMLDTCIAHMTAPSLALQHKIFEQCDDLDLIMQYSMSDVEKPADFFANNDPSSEVYQNQVQNHIDGIARLLERTDEALLYASSSDDKYAGYEDFRVARMELMLFAPFESGDPEMDSVIHAVDNLSKSIIGDYNAIYEGTNTYENLYNKFSPRIKDLLVNYNAAK